MQLKVLSAILTCLLLLTGCFGPKDYTFSMATDWNHDKKLQANGQQLTDVEKSQFAAYVTRIEQAGAAQSNASGRISIGEILALQAQWDNQPPEKHTVTPQGKWGKEAEHAMPNKEILALASPTAVPLNFSKGKNSDHWSLGRPLKNSGRKEIIGIQGTIVAKDNQDH
ncbi:hypothetical protein ACIOZM_28960 [Pseudomonas sp. NPDC087346]|uniref:hypothetical protein n=1 Tax=Pseudomonas sp. NPDC087346 TaxID=3364438 RepID=UPI003817F62E